MSDKEQIDGPKHDTNKSPLSFRRAKKLLILKEYLSKQESRNHFRKVSKALKKAEGERTNEEKTLLAENETIVKRIHKNKERRRLSEQRVLETEDNEETIQAKCHQLAEAIQQSKRTVVYTGAGISTAASIPDYRGPQGVWTLLQKGEQLQPQDLSDAEPTVTHMCITELYHRGHVKHVVSQNCDGLHVRSGLPRRFLSEVHGNMYIEVCYKCKPHREYMRLFDVTENTGVRRHHTGRLCQKCGGKLKDTIVHFGEKGDLRSPYRWKEAARMANKCDLILCLGSSLKILKKYGCLWCMDRAKNKRPNLVIVNLQWTPKDDAANIKINGRCDDILQRVMKILGYTVPEYSRGKDPIFRLATSLLDDEQNTFTKKVLQLPEGVSWPSYCDLDNRPSISEDSESSSSSDSTHVATRDAVTDSENHAKSTAASKPVRETKKGSKKEAKSESKGDAFLLKSQKICNEAKRAMQAKLCNSGTGKVSHAGSVSHSSINSSIPPMYANVHFPTTGQAGLFPFPVAYNGCTEGPHVPVIHPYDPHGPLSPYITGYRHAKLLHLHGLQLQLQALKQKQEILKQQESYKVTSPTSLHKHTPMSPTSPHKHTPMSPTSPHKQTWMFPISPIKHTPMSHTPPHKHTPISPTSPHKHTSISPTSAHKHTPMSPTSPHKHTLMSPTSPHKHTLISPTSLHKHAQMSHTLPGKHTQNSSQDIRSPDHSPNKSERQVKHAISQILGMDEPADVHSDKPSIDIEQRKLVEREWERTKARAIKQEQKTANDEVRQQQEKFQEEIDLMKAEQNDEHIRLYQLFLMQQQIVEQTTLDATKSHELMHNFLQQQQILVAQQNQRRLELQRRHETEFTELMNILVNRQSSSLLSGCQSGVSAMSGIPSPGKASTLSSTSSSWPRKASASSQPSPRKPSTTSFTSQSCSVSSILSSQSQKNKGTSAQPEASNAAQKSDAHSAGATCPVPRADEHSVEPNIPLLKTGKLPTGPDILIQKSDNNSVGPSSHAQKPKVSATPSEPVHQTNTHADIEKKANMSGDRKSCDKSEEQATCESCKFLKNYGIVKQRCAQCIALKSQCNASHGKNTETHPANDTQKIANPNYVPKLEKTEDTLGLPQVDIKSEIKLESEEIPNTVCSSADHKPGCVTEVQGITISGRVDAVPPTRSSSYLVMSGKIDSNEMKFDESESDVPNDISMTSSAYVGQSKGMDCPTVVKCELEQDTEAKATDFSDKAAHDSGEGKSAETVTSHDSVIVKIEITSEDDHTGVHPRTIRSHSQSEIYDQTSMKTERETVDTKYARSQSQVELSEVSSETIEKGASTGEKVVESNVKGGSKRKLPTVVSVPGWFGKGLNTKKRKRY